MARFRRKRHRAWIGLGVLLGLLVGGMPAGEDCPMLASAASASHAEADHRPDPGPAGRGCCQAPEALPSRAVLPASGPTGADPPCRTRTASCCCSPAASQAVAERSARPRASQPDDRGIDAGPVAPAAPVGHPLLLAATSSRPGTPKVPIYLRTARLRN